MPLSFRSSTRRRSLHGRLIAVLAVTATLSAGSVLAYDDGPPDGVAGDPPQFMNCTLCHDSYEVNSGNGGLQILDLPPVFTPGQSYDLRVRLFDPGQMRWGFEITAMDAQDQQAGTFEITDAVHTQLSDNPGTQPDYVKHTLDGTYWHTPDGPVEWTLRWTAPEVSSVTFYAAGNAADGTEDPGLDYIYLTQATVEQGVVAVQARSWTTVKALYRSH